MVVFAATAITPTAPTSIPASAHASTSSGWMVSTVTARCSCLTPSGFWKHIWMRVSTSSPKRIWALKAEASPTTLPVASSVSRSATVVVPMSTAAPIRAAGSSGSLAHGTLILNSATTEGSCLSSERAGTVTVASPPSGSRSWHERRRSPAPGATDAPSVVRCSAPARSPTSQPPQSPRPPQRVFSGCPRWASNAESGSWASAGARLMSVGPSGVSRCRRVFMPKGVPARRG